MPGKRLQVHSMDFQGTTMPDLKGQKLFVNLSPSQTRRRLKGFGHGVRKVQSAGCNQAVIVHTAAGQHFSELKAKFADVGFSSTEKDLLEPIENLRKLGSTTTACLREAGIITISELERLGPVLAYQLVKQKQANTNINLFLALAGALAGKDWRDLSEQEISALRQELESKSQHE
jgi:hypothetical protein